MSLSFGNPRSPSVALGRPADRPERIPARSNDARALELIEFLGRAYCGELAPRLGMGVGPTANLLKRLERRGLLVSEVMRSPASASTRRYFRLATLASAAPNAQEEPHVIQTATRLA